MSQLPANTKRMYRARKTFINFTQCNVIKTAPDKLLCNIILERRGCSFPHVNGKLGCNVNHVFRAVFTVYKKFFLA